MAQRTRTSIPPSLKLVLAPWAIILGLSGIPARGVGHELLCPITYAGTASTLSCVGDCRSDGSVTVDELLTMVNIALGNADISTCDAGDANVDGQITVDEILTAVNNALDGCSTPAFTEPPSITLVAPTDEHDLLLTWLPASGGTTPPDVIVYQVHVSTQAGFAPSAATLAASLVGETETTLSNLDSGMSYYVLVLAVDQAGNVSTARDYREVMMPAFPTVASSTPHESADDLHLGEPMAVSASSLTFAKTATAAAPAVGSVLAGLTADGGYLRRVQGVNATGSQIVVQTTPTSLGDAFDQMSISSNVFLFDVAAATQQSAASAARGRGVRMKTAATSAGTRYSRVEWPDRVLVAEETDYFDRRARMGDTAAAAGPALAAPLATITVGQELAVEVSLTFTPQLLTDARWSLAHGIESGRLIAHGDLTLDANATYSFKASGTADSGPVPIFTRTYTAIYDVGIPVLQRTTLSLEAEATATATAAVSAGADASASATAEVGVVYDPGSQAWKPVQSLSFANSFTAHLDVNGSVQGEVRLIPKLSVQFWELIVDATGTLSVEPFAGGTIGVQNTSIQPCAPLELTQFDFNLGVDCFASLDFTVFRHDFPLVSKLRVCGPLSYPLFSLPQLAVPTPQPGQPSVLMAAVTDGTNDPFDSRSAQWTFSPTDGGQLQVNPNDPLQATFTCGQSGRPVTITFAGHGILGNLAEQCQQVDVCSCLNGVVDPGEQCDVNLNDNVSIGCADSEYCNLCCHCTSIYDNDNSGACNGNENSGNGNSP